MRTFLSLVFIALMPMLAGCPNKNAYKTMPASDYFFRSIQTHCTKAYAGKLVAFNDSDVKLFSGPLIMHVRGCDKDVLRIAFHVGENRSRTWVITRNEKGLRLKHDHRHQDGSEDKLTQYGGDTISEGDAMRQEFPADDFSKAMFTREGMQVSTENIWALELRNQVFAYELRRPNRHFRVEFDLSKPVENPPAPWGPSH
jgi:hypothetical protein